MTRVCNLRCEVFNYRRDLARLELPSEQLQRLTACCDQVFQALEAFEQELAQQAVEAYPEIVVPITCLAPAAAGQSR